MSDADKQPWHYYLTYSGVKLPLKLVSHLAEEETRNRNTYFAARLDDDARVVACRKLVYGEVEFEHTYRYHDNGQLSEVTIDEAGDTRVVKFDEQGSMLT